LQKTLEVNHEKKSRWLGLSPGDIVFIQDVFVAVGIFAFTTIILLWEFAKP